MRTRSQSRNNFPQQEASPTIVEPLRIELPFLEDQFQEDPPEDPPEVPMADNRTMAELLQAPAEGYEDAIVIPEIAANNFELKHDLINLVQNKQFFGHDKEDPHAHIRYFNKITSTMRVPKLPSSSIKLILFSFSLEGAARIWLEKEPPRSILSWDDLVTKFINQFFPPSKTTNLRNEITRFQQRFDESFYEAWDRFNDLLRSCPHHGSYELHQLDTFYNALNVNDQDSLNSATGGNFLDKMPRECLKIIKSKSKVHQSRAKAVVAKVSTSSFTPAISSDVAELKDMVRALLLDKKNQSSAPASSPAHAPVKAVEPNFVTCGGTHSYQNCPANNGNVYRDNIQEVRTLPSNTITNPKEDLKGITTRSGVANQGSTIPTPSKVVKQGTKVTKDQVQTLSSQSTAPIQPSVIQSETQTPVSEPVFAPVSVLMPNFKPSIPYPSRRDNERRRDQANEQIEKFYEIFKDMNFEISFTDALILMPKFASTLKALIGNKEKLSKMARTPMNEHCLAVILNKFPRKLGDPGKFLIPCEFPGMDECLALADLGASINLMPLSVWEGLSLLELTSTFMTLELTDRLVSKPIGIAKDVSVKVEYSQEVLGFSDVTTSGNPTPYDDPIVSTTSPTITPFGDSDFLLFEEADAFLAILNSETLPPLSNHEQYMPSLKKELKVCKAKTVKSFVDEPPKVELKDLPPHLEYAFLEGDNKLPVIITKELGDEEKSALIKTMELFMDDFSIFGNSFENYLSRLDKMLQRIEVDKAKVDVIAKLPHLITVKGMDECLALADLGATINLMPLFVWEGLSLPELTPTCMTLELMDRSVSNPIGIAKDVPVKVGVFHFPADFVVVDFEPDPRVPLILRRYTTASGNPTPYDYPFFSTTSPTLNPFGDSDFLLFEKADAFLGLEDDPNSPEFNPFYYDPKGDILLLEAILNSKPLPPLPNHEQYLPSYKKELKVCDAKTVKSSVDKPSEVELKDLPPHLECMLAIFHDMVEKTIEVFMDDFSVFGNSFENYLSRLDKMLKRCEDTNLSLNWEKSHFMIKEGIVLGHKISKNGIEVDKAKVNVIAKLTHPTTVK
nr:reverse transcriptase domain-containing protein [Tanacetum cinerariifolium]